MSKIGRKPIKIDGLAIDVKGQDVHYKGANGSGMYRVAPELDVRVEDKNLYLTGKDTGNVSPRHRNTINRVWGLNRALLANELSGAVNEFEVMLEIHGLGYKAALADKQIILTLGYSHKIEKDIPKGISIEIDRSGQKVKVKSVNKFLLGQFCSEIRAFRSPEPYKGKGVRLQTEVVFRKTAGKGKK